MRSLTTLLLAWSSTALALPSILSPVPITPAQGPKEDGSYIVKLHDDVNKDTALKSLLSKLNVGPTIITYDYNADFVNAFAGKFSKATLPIVQTLSGVEAIYEDAIVTINAVQTDATWGLERISKPGPVSGSDPTALTYTYKYPDSAGAGVDVYIIDTGINIEHETFGGRAQHGFYPTQYGSANDGNGHGTHCAGTAVGRLHGVAKLANAIGVKVLSDGGAGSISDVIAGLDWSIARAKNTGHPSVVSMSLASSANQMFDDAVTRTIRKGLHVVVAAGNANEDAKNTSPARAPLVTTVGALTINNVKAGFSNYGSVVDIWAPGQHVTSSWIGSTTAVRNLSGTSMATPHVAGLYALYLAMPQYAPIHPVVLAEIVKKLADKSADGLPVAQVPGL